MRALYFIFGFLLCLNHIKCQVKILSTPIVKDSIPSTTKSFQVTATSSPINKLEYIGPYRDTVEIGPMDYSKKIWHSSLVINDDLKRKGLMVIVSIQDSVSIDLENYAPPPPPLRFDKPLIIEDYVFDPESFESDSLIEFNQPINEVEAELINFINWPDRPRDYVKALAVYIINPSTDTVYVSEQDSRVIMIQEAKNAKGKWQPIEYWAYSFCGHSYGSFGLLPGEIAILKIFRYSGSFETELRVKLKNDNKIYYSNAFKRSINPEQFKLADDHYKMRQWGSRFKEKEYLKYIYLKK